jgi:anthranilate phosphoribosyltransferase
VANALAGLKTDRAFVVHSEEGLDEISLCGRTTVLELHRGDVRRTQISPEDFGIAPATAESLKGGDAKTNASIIEGILGGEKGPRRDIVLINAATALVAAGSATSFLDGVRAAADAIDSGKAAKTLRDLRELSR